MSTIVDVTPVAIAGFDYSALGNQLGPKVEQITREIKNLVQQDAFTRCQVGERLLEIKEMLSHGQWLDWLEHDFPWSDRQAQYLMQAAKTFGDQIRTGFVFEARALRMLSGESVPEEARTEAIEIAEEGATVTNAHAEALIKKYAPPTPEPELQKPEPRFIPAEPPQQSDEGEARSPMTYQQVTKPKAPTKADELQGMKDIAAIEQIRIDELELLVKSLDDLLQQVLGWCGDSVPGEMIGEASKLHHERLEMID